MSSPITQYGQQGQQQSGPIMLSKATSSERTAFLFKVYSLLSVGVFFYFVCMAVPMAGLIFGVPVLEDIALFFIRIPFLLALGLIIGMSFFASAVQNIKGLNLLGFFSVSLVYGLLSLNLIAYALFSFVPEGVQPSISDLGPGLAMILQAFIITVAAMGGLTAYVLITKKDFSFIKGFIWTGLFIGLGVTLVAFLFSAFGAGDMLGVSFDVIHVAVSGLFVLVFMGFVLYDTSRILLHYPTTAVVPAAMSLLIDFIILFRNILVLLMASRR